MATAGALFMYLADEIGEQAWLAQVDLAIAQFFHDHGTLWALRLFEAITFFGNASTLCVIGLVTALVLAFQRRWSLLLGWAVALIGAVQQRRKSRSHALHARTWFRIVGTIASGKKLTLRPAVKKQLFPRGVIRLPWRS
jgi:hypothetical protein